MKILCTATSWPPAIGGAQYHAHFVAAQIARSNEVRAVCLWDRNRTDWLLGTTLQAESSERRYAIDGVRVRRLGFRPAEKARMAPWVSLYFPFRRAAITALAELLRQKIEDDADAIDLVHNARIGREPISFASFAIARAHGVPFLMTPYHHPWWRSRWHREYHRLYRMADGVIALTEAEKQALVKLGVAQDRITVTGTGPVLEDRPDPLGFRARHRLDGPFVLFLGQKYRYKNLRGLLHAARRVWQVQPDTRFVFVGPRTNDSRILFTGARDPRILELGAVSLQEKTDALAACTLLCQPSTQESFGAVFIEAWLMEKPVVGTNIPAVAEVISSGIDGIVAEPTPDSLAEAICSLLLDPGRAREMAARGREKALRHFTWEALARKTERAYAQALGQ